MQDVLQDVVLQESILWEKDYSVFKFSDENRETDPNHVMRLVKKMQREGVKDYPILVTKQGYVIDGQHTLRAREILGEPIPYVVSSSLEETDSCGLNSGRKEWRFNDYLDRFVKSGNKHYVALKKLIHLYPGVHPSVVWDICDGRTNQHNTKDKETFNDGLFEFPFDNEAKVSEKLEKLHSLVHDYEINQWMSLKTFQIASIVLMKEIEFQTHRFVKIFQIQRNHVELRIAKAENSSSKLVAKLGELYNKGLRVKEQKLSRFDF